MRPPNAVSPVLAVAGLITFVAGIANSLQLADNPQLLNWSFTHWAFTYDYGVVKRSLVGETLSHFVAGAGLLRAVYTLALLNSILVTAGLVYFFWRPYLQRKTAGAFVFALLASTHFATLQHFFYDLGRMDQFGLMLSMLCIVSIERLSRPLAAVALFFACATGIFIHEAFVAIYMPLIFAYWLVRDPSQHLVSRAQLCVSVLLLSVVFFMMSRGSPSIAQADYLELLKAAHGGWIDEGSISVLYGGVGVESSRAIALLFDKYRLVQHALLGTALLPSGLLLWRALRSPASRNAAAKQDIHNGLVMLAALSPLALYVIGIDFARWWALALTNLLLAVSLCASMSERVHERIEFALSGSPAILCLALAANLVCGPLGVAASAFPRLQPYVVAIMDAVIHWLRG